MRLSAVTPAEIKSQLLQRRAKAGGKESDNRNPQRNPQ